MTLNLSNPKAVRTSGGMGKMLLLVLICVAWIMPGLVGHEPWKPDEAYSFGLVNHIIKTGDWVVPTLAGEPFMEKPPLFYMTAAVFARLFSAWLPAHDAARLASGFYMALTLLFAGLAGRELYGKGKGIHTALALIGRLGLLLRAHELITDLSLLSGIAIALYGLALSLRRHILGGVLLGTGVGIGFMSKGLIGPGMIGIIAVVLPALFKPWRNLKYLATLATAFLAVLPWITIWPYALYQHSPKLFMDWFWVNNLGRFFGFTDLGPDSETATYLRILPWFAWPALPLAIWTLWSGRKGLFTRPEIHFPLTVFVVMFAVLSSASDAREVYALPMLLPLAYLAAASVDTLRRGASNALYWFGVMGFIFFAGIIWFYWIAMTLGMPAELSAHIRHLHPDYSAVFNRTAFVLALLYTAGWAVLVFSLKRSKGRPIIVWALGMTMVWGLLMTLFIGLFDSAASYRSTMMSLSRAIPSRYNCMSSHSLGESQRAMLEYYANVLTQRVETGKGAACNLALIQGDTETEAAGLGPEWKKIWEGRRTSDKAERYQLFQRKDAAR